MGCPSYPKTYSIFWDRNLIKKFIIKVKNHFNNMGLFLLPFFKGYGLITEEGNEIVKIKGLSKDAIENIKVTDLEQLLKKDASKQIIQSNPCPAKQGCGGV